MPNNNPRYGDLNYWNDRYSVTSAATSSAAAGEEGEDGAGGGGGSPPFDWLCDFDQLRPALDLLIPKSGLTLVVGCGDAPFSPDLYFRGGFKRTIHVDYSDVVIEVQRRKYPEMDWRVMDALDMPFRDGTFDAVIDKSLIDTTMCYQDGHETTERLFAELHRVLKPGGRLLTVSLHSEDEVVRYRFSPAVSHCRLINRRRKPGDNGGGDGGDGKPQYHAMAVFDKLDGTSIDDKIRILDQHPIDIPGAARDDVDVEDEVASAPPKLNRPGSESDMTPSLEALSMLSNSQHASSQEGARESVGDGTGGDGGGGDGIGGEWDPKEDPPESAENIAQLMSTVDSVLEDLMRLHDRAKALARERASEEEEAGRGSSSATVAGLGENSSMSGAASASVGTKERSDL